MARGRVAGYRPAALKPRGESAVVAKNTSDYLRDLWAGLAGHIDAVFEEHRLAYAFKDEDNADDRGKVPTVFVCVCKNGYERRNFNIHLREELRAPFLAFLGEKESELKALVE